MKLSEFLNLKRLKDQEFGIAVGVSRATVSRLRREKMSPSIGLAGRIAEITNGAVTANDFLPSSAVPRPTPSAPEKGEEEITSISKKANHLAPRSSSKEITSGEKVGARS